MKKDVIYIDIEDEITGIISKLKDSKAKIVALVPPKRSTVLNSVVNLKLLKRAADDNKKRIVLITNERSLLALAGGLDLHVAKNLHSKPEIPEAEEAPEVDDSVIEGVEIDISPEETIGELDEKHKNQSTKVDLSELNQEEKKDEGPKSQDAPKKVGAIKKGGLKVPNFETFRLKVIFGVVAVVFLIGLWVWAFQIAPKATVDITAQTSKIDTEIALEINSTFEATNIEEGQIKAQRQTIKRTVSEQFDATGEKDVGDQASGELTIQNCRQSDPYEIVVGTTFTSDNGLIFETNETVVVPGGSFVLSSCTSPGEATVGVTATESGDNYNLAPQSYTAATAGIDGFGGQMSGGTSEKITVVSQSDFDAAKKTLQDREFDEVKAEVQALFDGEVIVIDESFEVIEGDFSSDPKVGAEADKATASVEVTFSLLAVDRTELAQAIDADVNDRISTDQQSIYESGIDNVNFRLDKRITSKRLEVTVFASTFVGPEINTEQLANEIAGKAFSEARATVEALPGVRSVDIDFDPFWISKAPRANKITIVIEVAESTLQ